MAHQQQQQSPDKKVYSKTELLEYHSKVFDKLSIKNRLIFKHIILFIHSICRSAHQQENNKLLGMMAEILGPCIINIPLDSKSSLDRIDQQTFTYLVNNKPPLSEQDKLARDQLSLEILEYSINYLAFSKLNVSGKKHVIKGEETLYSCENVFCEDKLAISKNGKQFINLGEMWMTNYRMVFIPFPSISFGSSPGSPTKKSSGGSSGSSGSDRDKSKKRSVTRTNSSDTMTSHSFSSGDFIEDQPVELGSCEIPFKMIHRWIRITSPLHTKNGGVYDLIKLYLRDFRIKIVGFPRDSAFQAKFVGILERYTTLNLRPSNIFAFHTHPQPTDQICHTIWTGNNVTHEFNRLNISWDNWRTTNVNSALEPSKYYPRISIVPKNITEDQVYQSLNHRNSRFPVLTWVHPTIKSALCRASSPNFLLQLNASSSNSLNNSGYNSGYNSGINSGMNSKVSSPGNSRHGSFASLPNITCPEDDRILQEISNNETNVNGINGKGGLIIYDITSNTNSNTLHHSIINAMQFHGSSSGSLGNISASVTYNLYVPHIENVRDAYYKILLLHEEQQEPSWENVVKFEWLNLLKPILTSAISVSNTLARGQNVLIQNNSVMSDFDVQISCLAQILLDPHFRTLSGFRVLIEKEWLSYGHPFAKRANNDISQTSLSHSSISSTSSSSLSVSLTGHDEVDSQFSPIFMQFIFIIWQLVREFPTEFEFNELYLLTLVDNVFLNRFGTFLCNNVSEREYHGIYGQTKCFWRHVQNHRFLNPLFVHSSKQLKPQATYSNVLWNSFYLRYHPTSVISQEILGKNLSNIVQQNDEMAGEEPIAAEFSNISLYYISDTLFDGALTTNIVELSFANNNLSLIPICISKLVNLERLSLHSNKIVGISEDTVKYIIPKSLKHLNLSSNHIEDLPLSMVELVSLETLDISNNPFKKMPIVLVEHLSNLVSLNLSYCKYLDALNIPVSLVRTLRFLDLRGLHGVQTWPESIGNLLSLQVLNISENDFSLEGRMLPWSLSKLIHLEELYMDSCNLISFPLQILSLANLKKLVISNNFLTSLPNDISVLTNLSELNLAHNKLDILPSTIGELHQLQTLAIQNNMITKLHPSMSLLKNLYYLTLEANPIQTPPPEILQKGTGAILQFLKDLTKGSQECYRMKLMVVGQENVGKTTLIKVLRDKKKAKILASQPNISTDGIIIDDWVIQGGHVRTKSKVNPDQITLTTMDFAGQEIYYTTHQFFLSERSIYIIVWNTVLEEEKSKVEFWLQSISTRAPNSPIIIVGTHIDSLQSGKLGRAHFIKEMEQKYLARFPTIRAIKMVSCTTGKGISSLRAIIEDCASHQPNMGELLPSSYLLLENQVKEERRIRAIPTIPWSEFVLLGKMCHIDSEQELVRATMFLNQLGSLVYFPNESGLKKIVILDPQWITLMLSSIITVKHNYSQSGVIMHKNLQHIWKSPNYPKELHPHLLVLLERFEISFNFSGRSSAQDLSTLIASEDDDNSMSLIPALLSNERPGNLNEVWEEGKNSNAPIQYSRQYKFEFIPNGLFSRLMVRILNFAKTESRFYWRNGILLQRDDELILIEMIDNLKMLRFTVRGNGNQPVAQLSRDVIDTIQSLLENSFKLKATEVTIPCIHCIQEGNYDYPYLFPLEQCENAVLNCLPYLKCRGKINVRTDLIVPDLSMYSFNGTKISKKDIQVQQMIGEGGSALVYIGTYKNRTVAIKKLKVDQLKEPEEKEQLSRAFDEFRRECWLMSGLDHPNIVELKGLCLEPLAVVTEYLPEGNLHKYIQNQRELATKPIGTHRSTKPIIEWSLALNLAIDIASGMSFLHNSSPPILHRDLKSPNILLCHQNGRLTAKVGDFGLSGLQYTIINRCVINPVWLAPEVMKGGETSTKSDVYSFGVILWEILTGQEFFGYVSFMSQIEDMVMQGQRPEIPDSAHPQYSNLIQACWQPEPKKRPTFTSILNELKEIKEKTVKPIEIISQ